MHAVDLPDPDRPITVLADPSTIPKELYVNDLSSDSTCTVVPLR